MKQELWNKYGLWLLISLALLTFVFHLGELPLLADEATRSVVALELDLNENFIVPTIAGELYLNKPPLYNWLILVFFRIFGFSEFALRLPSILSLVAFSLTIYMFAKKQLGHSSAIIGAAIFLSSGRILIYSSLLGHMDFFCPIRRGSLSGSKRAKYL